jgi:hypothetical protein
MDDFNALVRGERGMYVAPFRLQLAEVPAVRGALATP